MVYVAARECPQRMLRWHYRSRHHSLIAVSNHEFYDDRLFVVPSPGDPAPTQGFTFTGQRRGLRPGGSATNRVEARAVAEAVMAQRPRAFQTSLWASARSPSRSATRSATNSNYLRRSDPSLEHFFATARPEPFFVKNLENIQGDERDVIFISVGYGKNESGYMAMNFGPLSNDGGERRLNVLITAGAGVLRGVLLDHGGRHRPAARAVSRGQSAENVLEVRGNRPTRIQDCPLAEVTIRTSSVRSRRASRAGFPGSTPGGCRRVLHRLGRRRPEMPGRYLLGIECDGANYHSSRSARDRDRLRAEVLEDRGWILHRIWSTDWFHRPDDELRKAMAAIERAKIEWAKRSTVEDRPADQPVPEPTEIVRTECNGNGCEGHGCSPSQPYVVASFRINTNRQIHEVSPAELAPVVLKIIKVEGPIHGEEIARRVTQLWGLRRTGKRIRDAVAQAIRSAARSSGVQHDGEFYSLSSQPEVLVRDRGDVAVATLRCPEMLPPAEVREKQSQPLPT